MYETEYSVQEEYFFKPTNNIRDLEDMLDNLCLDKHDNIYDNPELMAMLEELQASTCIKTASIKEVNFPEIYSLFWGNGLIGTLEEEQLVEGLWEII